MGRDDRNIIRVYFTIVVNTNSTIAKSAIEKAIYLSKPYFYGFAYINLMDCN
jgi:hypothetical protein